MKDKNSTGQYLPGDQNPKWKGGRSRHPLYQVWRDMVNRCYRRRNEHFHAYGGRGITVCDRWRHDVLAFASDMGPKPSPAHSLDRINNNGNYEPSNCRWATPVEQVRNSRVATIDDFDAMYAVCCYERGLTTAVTAKRIGCGEGVIEAIRGGRTWRDVSGYVRYARNGRRAALTTKLSKEGGQG